MVFGRKGLSGAAAAAPAPAPAGSLSDGPLFAAIQYVGMVSPPGAYVESLASPMPCAGSSGTPGVRFAITTNEGPGFAFFFPNFASVWIGGEPRPRPEIPTEMIAGRVPGYGPSLAQLLAG